MHLFDGDGETVQLKVFIDGAIAEVAKASAQSISATASPVSNKSTLSVAVTTRDEKLINVLAYDTTTGQFRKLAAESKDNETLLVEALEKAANRIVAAITSQKGAGRPAGKG